MGRIGRWAVLSGFLGLTGVVAALAVAQEKEPPKKDVPKAAGPEAKTPAAKPAAGGFVKLAPGVVITIPPEKQKGEDTSTHDLIRLLEKDPNFGERQNPNKPGDIAVSNLAKKVRLSHNIWTLEFNFKSMRMIEVDVPRPGAKFDRKMIWYMPYFVRYLAPAPAKKAKAKEGEAEAPKAEAEPAATDAKLPAEVKFLPRFVLFSDQKTKTADGREIPKTYTDRLIPVAMDPIRLREDPRRALLNSVEISEKPIQLSTDAVDNAVWGVATWEDIDPKTVYFSVYIQGLTNAYKIETMNEKDAEGKEAKRWRYLRKTLVLNFWRPGDEFLESDREIRYGQPNNVEHTWEYK